MYEEFARKTQYRTTAKNKVKSIKVAMGYTLTPPMLLR
jgi:hypothetical protein